VVPGLDVAIPPGVQQPRHVGRWRSGWRGHRRRRAVSTTAGRV